MADNDWKVRLGFSINVSSDDEDIFNEKNEFEVQISEERDNLSSVDSVNYMDDPPFTEFDKYGATPPRTRILRRQRERKQRDSNQKTPKTMQSKFYRRNTYDSLYFNELCQKADNGVEPDYQVRKAEKRSMKLLRGSERDLKLDIESTRIAPVPPTPEPDLDDRANSMPLMESYQPNISTMIETCNRFKSLTSRPVCRWKEKIRGMCQPSESSESETYQNDRSEYHSKLLHILCSGSEKTTVTGSEKTTIKQVSVEEQLWQNEVQDLIWLELQARYSDRTLIQQDAYICSARESVGQLLQDIMAYKYNKDSGKKRKHKTSVHSADSGINADTSPTPSDTVNITLAESTLKGKANVSSSTKFQQCIGCLSMYCAPCIESQNEALHEVEELLNKLDAAEALYPSNKAFGEHYPLYKSPQFVGRVKAMCLWYNLMKHQRLKLLILGKLMVFLQGRQCQWPMQITDFDNSSTSGVGTNDSSDDASSLHAEHNISRSASLEPPRKYSTQFDLEASSSPSDSNNSTASSAVDGCGSLNNEEDFMKEKIKKLDYFNVAPIASLEKQMKMSPYRKYIEDVLKTKGLRKALYFLELLHQTLLRKAQITLEKPPEGMTIEEFSQKLCQLKPEDGSHEVDECELRRYGSWSPEAQELQLPSYRAAFIFLSLVPLEVIHEFLRMRLEQKPDQPSPLSIRQLMRELKEGLKIAVLHRQRILTHFNTVLSTDEEFTEHQKLIDEFDQSVKDVFELYLEYVQQWSLTIQQETIQKSMLEDEWYFVKCIGEHVPGTDVIVVKTFCTIVNCMLCNIGKTLKFRVDELAKSVNTGLAEDDLDEWNSMVCVCRELHKLLNEERERSLKAISFAKTMQRESWPLLKNEDKYVFKDTFGKVKDGVVNLRKQVVEVIERVEEIFDSSAQDKLDDNEKAYLSARCRDILHQAFRFGFEYQKEVNRLVRHVEEARKHISLGMVDFANQWINFVLKRCEKGRGKKPRWAVPGITYLITVSEASFTHFLSDEEFEKFQENINRCIEHLIGTASSTPSPEIYKPHWIMASVGHVRSRGSSPLSRPRTSSTTDVKYLANLSTAAGRKDSTQSAPSNDQLDGISKSTLKIEIENTPHHKSRRPSATMQAPRQERIRDAVNRLEMALDERLRDQELIGQVTATHPSDRVHIRARSVIFSWQRGIKIGQGRFGKVYTAVNNQTGEMMAMKEISLQPNDHKTIKRVAEELKIFEGIKHENLIRYYGVEIHREEMLIFMEFCAEGTLESLVTDSEDGLPEALVRRYNSQLLAAVSTLHDYAIVHRDIKSANIFLTDEGNCLKLGDFGSAVKIRAQITMPGELQGFVGTQAYMAPEVFMKNNSEGHGRAADIWSVGCVVVEMASGKRPWSQYDSNYQIMFVVGMGETPEAPERLSEEGKQFLTLCLQHDPRNRSTARELLQHNFIKVDDAYLH